MPDFERWSGLRVGRGRSAVTIAPEKQVEFLARTLADYTQRVGGDDWEAVRAWHAGMGGRDRPHAREYEDLIRGHEPVVMRGLAPTAGAEPPEAASQAVSTFEPAAPAREPLRLDAPAGAPVTKSLDYGDV